MAVEMNDVIRWFHLLAATVWVGGMITVAAIVPALRSNGVSRKQLQAMARRFGAVSWLAMAVAITTGIAQIFRLDVELTGALAAKLILVGAAVMLAFAHREIARNAGPAWRGVMEGALLMVGLGILAAAVAL